MKMNSKIARTSIDLKIVYRLWGVAAGRCEMCNRILYSDPTFGTPGNFAENAHICGIGENGPRHKENMTKDEINCIDNLMLLCPVCHKMIDSSEERFTDSQLINRKRGHEERVRWVTDIKYDQTCRIVAYFVNIDAQKEIFDEKLFKEALIFAQRVPLQNSIIELHDSTDTNYVAIQDGFKDKANILCRNFNEMFSRIHDQESIAIFALAPQPLLIKLGTLINDQYNAVVFQCHRDGHKWAWKNETITPEFFTKTTKESNTNQVALVVDLSAQVTDDRIISVFDHNITIYHLSIDDPNRNFVTSPVVQNSFISVFRSFIEEIKNSKNRPDVIHLFPVMPNSLNVRMGMDYMPKADLPWIIYEQANAKDGFFAALTIRGNES
jgi:hypothetical protein